MLLDSINYLAILVAAIAAFAVGALWYGALFSSAWIKAVGKPREQLGQPAPAMIVSFVGYFLLAFMTAVVQFWVGVVSPGQGIAVAIMLWLGFSITSFAPGIMYTGASRKLLWIDGGHLLAAFIVVGAIIAVWPIAKPVF